MHRTHVTQAITRGLSLVALSVGLLAGPGAVPAWGAQGTSAPLGLPGPTEDVWVISEDQTACPEESLICAEVIDSATGSQTELCCISPVDLGTMNFAACVYSIGLGPVETPRRDTTPE